MKYLSAKERKLSGAHYTPEILAEFVASQILTAWAGKSKSDKIRVLDPGAGDGELLFSITGKLWQLGYHNLDVCGFDTDQGAIDFARQRICQSFPQLPLFLVRENFLDFVLDNCGRGGNGTLLSPMIPEPFDLVIANPPYVRTQVIGAQKSQALRQQFGLSGRLDLYHAFLMGITRVLKAGGVAGIIVSNRFLSTKSGSSIRKSILNNFEILHVWDLGDTRLFQAAVLPAVLLVRRTNKMLQAAEPRFTSIYSTTVESAEHHSSNPVRALTFNGVVKIDHDTFYEVKNGYLDTGDEPGDVWRISDEDADGWLKTVKSHTFCNFGDIGKIRVGIKTCADKIFIRCDWNDLPEEERPEGELLKPLITHSRGRRFKTLPAAEKGKKILYPHTVVQGKRTAIKLENYPKAARYFHNHRRALEGRKYLIDTGRNWYEIWVPQNPESWAKTKLVWRDITKEPAFWMDLEGSVVNGDCYWLTNDRPDQERLLWLALAVGNSSFIKEFYDRRFNNRLYAGRRRFITQYVEKFPLPDPGLEISRKIIKLARIIYEQLPHPEGKNLEKHLDQLVREAFGTQGG